MRPDLLDPSGELTPTLVVDSLLLADPRAASVVVEDLADWSPMDLHTAYDWATREHLAAADNPVKRRPMPVSIRRLLEGAILDRRVSALEKLVPPLEEQDLHVKAHREIEARLGALESPRQGQLRAYELALSQLEVRALEDQKTIARQLSRIEALEKRLVEVLGPDTHLSPCEDADGDGACDGCGQSMKASRRILNPVRMRRVLLNARAQIALLGSDTDDVNQAHLDEIDETLRELGWGG